MLKRLRNYRKALGLSQEAFAERAGLQYKHYQAIEAGRKPKIQFPTLLRLAEACGLELWELLHPDTEPLAVGEEPAKDDYPTPVRRRRKS
ncbi:MAG: helix-turn-helix transcriptional regulator [Verrucomicrobia bacterium]|nr:helix-turn-helix transcriptional regulator [Verrucomicrobiota bacterium]